MVNFNDQTTMTRPRKDIVNIMILQELQNMIDSIEYLELREGRDRTGGLPELKAIVLKIIALIRTPLERQLQKEKMKYIPIDNIIDLRQTIKAIGYEEIELLYNITDYIERFLYEKDVTRWDTKEHQDRTDILDMNSKVLSIR
jgi:hypothetical protein